MPTSPTQKASLPILVALAVVASCSDDPLPAAGGEDSLLLPGELCDSDNRPELRLSFDPPTIVVAPGKARPVRLTIEPDACVPAKATFTTSNLAVSDAPAAATFDLRHATYDFQIRGGVLGEAVVSASMESVDVNGKPYTVKVDLPIEVRDPTPPTCTSGEGTAQATLAAGTHELRGQGALAKASVTIAGGAFTRQDEFALPSFPAEVACGGEELFSAIDGARLKKLGPAVTFAARAPLTMSKPLRREIDFAIPVNPAAFPDDARMRHLHVLYKGPRAKTARAIPVANPRIDKDGTDYVLRFSSPWFGTYQAAIEEDAGTKKHMRKITHRAVIGFSMGGGGAASFGMRHHDKFDVIGPLGGPSDWTYLLHYIDEFALGGFCKAGTLPENCPKIEPNRYPMVEPYGHTMDFDHWFFQKGNGNGGGFPRDEYIQIFEDLALAMGNPNGDNANPGMGHMAMGPKKEDAWSLPPGAGLASPLDCTYTVDPISDDPATGHPNPNEKEQKERDQRCKALRCDPKNAWKAETGYYDDEYNPDGTLPVISFCDGAEEGESPYQNTFKAGGTKPVNLALAVDLNKNGIRDFGEPIIRSSHESYDDCGADGVCNAQEPGYDAENNPDPNQDDYDYQLNPTGTEGNYRYDLGEPYRDDGLDGVPNTKGLHVAGDPGEGDGVYTEAKGLTSFYENDAHSMIAGRAKNIPGGALDERAIQRLDILTDGGVRDLFNFSVAASHLSGQLYARKRAAGLPVRSLAYYNGFDGIPGQTFGKPDDFTPSLIRWADVADLPSIRYGNLDATAQQILDGDGQHVGKANQLLFRLETAFFYVGKAWPDADRRQTIESRDEPAPGLPDCEVLGRCEEEFRGPKSNRTGPVSISLPPGYAQKNNVERNVRYPVLYVLHGYGQEPKELEGVAIFTNNFMNVAHRSYATRLPKFIIVYVDGRCRQPDMAKQPECIRGTFYLNSARDGGVQLDTWFDELVDHIDQKFRTMPATEVEVAD